MKKFFYKFFSSAHDDQPNIKFGRYSDSYKEEEKYDAWDIALENYENGKYISAFEYFLIYLRDEELGNLKYTKSSEGLTFEIFQGSKKITGYATEKKLYAEAKIAKSEELSIGFLRRLIEANYHLEYTRFALDKENCITMVFDTFVLDASPYKLYYALKELATNADKQDDILISEFDALKPVNTYHIREISEKEKVIKYNYFKSTVQKITGVLENSKLNITHYPGAASYLVLDGVYKLDFLIKPEGVVMEELEQIQDIFFKDKTKSAEEKNVLMIKKLQILCDINQVDFNKELYEVVSTFGVTLPSGHERLRSLIQSELPNMKWYYDQGHDEYAMAIPGYIVGYCLYNFALPAPDKEFLLLFYKIMEQDFFNELGYKLKFQTNGKINKNEVLKALKKKRNLYLLEYPKLNMSLKVLNFDNKTIFCKTYLEMLNNMNVTRIKRMQ
jgi:hypothetical protein